MELDGEFKDRLPMLGVLHLGKIPGNGVDGGRKDDEENTDPVPMIGCAPLVCGTKRLTADIKGVPTLEEWEAPTINEVDVPSKLRVPNMVETMALIEDTVGVALPERLGFSVWGGGVTPTVVGVIVSMVSGLRILAMKDTVEAAVDGVDPSISKGGVASPNIGLLRSKYGKGRGDTLCLFGEGDGGG